MTKHRLELFSDGVFAIVLTLLVLNLKVPVAFGFAGFLEVAPALLVHAASFFLVGVLWLNHHGALARVDKISYRALLFNLLALFWVTLLPFAAENAAYRPFDSLGASLIAFCCGAHLLSFMAMRLSSHSTVDDLSSMRRWRQTRIAAASCMVVVDLACAFLAWAWPWLGYAGGVMTTFGLMVLRSPPEAEDYFRRAAEAAAAA
jgi:uncharacterized membrane protein